MPAVTFDLKLIDDESVKEKLTVMTPLEAVFDDSRNDVPDAYYEAVGNMKPGQTIRISVEVFDTPRDEPGCIDPTCPCLK